MNQQANQYFDTRLQSFTDLEALPEQSDKQAFRQRLTALGGMELEKRRREIQHLLRENGVTYTVYHESSADNRAWRLDPVPLLIEDDEWRLIEQGLQQRAMLMNLLLQDLYGEQRVLKQGVLPPELIFGHQGFYPACCGMPVEGRNLTVYAANLARGSQGRLWVLNDQTQAPSGMGYSLENRNVAGRVMADLLSDIRIRRLSPFMTALQRALTHLAPHHKDEPHIAILTPGSLNETYFEHAYLAAKLGFTLAQGDDLTVRDNKLWLRTIEGLQPVDVLLRRVDDGFCDPLELRGNSRLGIPGLLQVVRLGNVGIANPLGAGVLENPGLLAFLPGLGRYFLNEELRLPSAASWWCGQKKERDFVIQNLSQMAVKCIHRSSAHRTVFGHQLSAEQRQVLIAAIKARPHLYVGQEQISFSTAPTLIEGEIHDRQAVFRGFAVAVDGEYHVMPGGLTRAAAEKDQFAVSNQFGALSKDTWVVSEAEQPYEQPQRRRRQKQYNPAISEPLTSRAADNIFWVGRHFERLFTATGLLRNILDMPAFYANGDGVDKAEHIPLLLRALTHVTASYPGFVGAAGVDLNQEIIALFKDQQRYGSLAYNIEAFFQSAFQVRDLWSQDTWRCIDALHKYWGEQIVGQTISSTGLSGSLLDLNMSLGAFSGLTAESMTRESGWLMLNLGRRLERALVLIALLRAGLVHQHQGATAYLMMESVLLAADSFNIYQHRYRSPLHLPLVLELLLVDEKHPYSLLFQLQSLQRMIDVFPMPGSKNHLPTERRLIIKCCAAIQLCTPTQLLKEDNSGVYQALDKLLGECTDDLWLLADAISRRYFNHVPLHGLAGDGLEEAS